MIATTPPVPELTTASGAPLHALEQTLVDNHSTIEGWFRDQFISTPPPFYCSVDIRNSGRQSGVEVLGKVRHGITEHDGWRFVDVADADRECICVIRIR